MKRPRILIAENYLQMAIHVHDLLHPEFEVLGILGNGQELIDAALELQPDGIVLDISMPVMNGIAAVRRLRELRSAAKGVFLTQHTDATFVEAALHAGGDGYVVKRCAATELREALQAVLSGRRFVSPSLAAQLGLAASPSEEGPLGSR